MLALLVALDWAIRRPDGRTRALNEAIQMAASPQLKNYPYPFHVLRVEGNTAIMGTPRNFDMPAFRFLGAMYPDVNVKDHDNPAFIALEDARPGAGRGEGDCASPARDHRRDMGTGSRMAATAPSAGAGQIAR